MAYILGFIGADGSVFKNTLKICLQDRDVDILKKIAKSMDYDGKIKSEKAKVKDKIYHVKSLYIYSKKICDSLSKLNVYQNKTFNVIMPNNIPQKYKIDYIRGYFDGDGSVSEFKPKNQMGFRTKTTQIKLRICSGSYILLDQIIDTLKINNINKVKIHKKSQSKIFEICYSTLSAIKIYDLFYKNATIYLDRKKNKFTSIINKRNKEILKNTFYS